MFRIEAYGKVYSYIGFMHLITSERKNVEEYTTVQSLSKDG
jgi:hypothetical protein